MAKVTKASRLTELIEAHRNKTGVTLHAIASACGIESEYADSKVWNYLHRNDAIHKSIIDWALANVLPEHQLYMQGLTETQVAAVMEMIQGFRRANAMATGMKDSGEPIASANASGAKPPSGNAGARAPQSGEPDPKKEAALRVLGGQLPEKPLGTSRGAPPLPASPEATPPKAPGAGPRKPGKPRAYANRPSPRK